MSVNGSQRAQPLVLVADDDDNMRLLTRESLEQAGFHVEEAEDGAQALSAVDLLQPDIVLLDVMMPQLDGFSVCRQLRTRPGGKHMPVLMVTGLDDSESINRGYDAGATDFISKPIKWTTLAYHVRYMLRAASAMVDLEKSNRVKDEFLGVMSHELRTPLNIIMGYTALIKDGAFGAEMNPEQQKALEIIVKQSDSLLGMINSIMEATKIESGASLLQIDDLSLVEFFDNLKSISVSPAHKEIALNWNYPTDLPPMRTDGEKLRHIVMNLINNAIKFTEQGSVTISVRVAQSEQLEVQVSDTGIGIAPELLPAIFDKFRQLDGSQTRDYGGVGLGLHIVKVFTNMLGGKIDVDSKPGHGSTFKLSFPLHLDA